MFIRTTQAATTRRGIVGIAVVGCVCALAAWSIQQQDRPYDESTVLAGWRARRARPPATVEIPPGLALPETSAGEAVRPEALLLDDPRNLERLGTRPL